ncbi:MAG: hypothetical protein AB7T31_05715 [Gemmatimonadales bacterium]
MRRLGFAFAVWSGVGSGITEPAAGQDQGAATGLINLFFDCPTGGCGDLDYLRREVPFVNWMRDRADADLHVLVTSQLTGGGGRSYTVAFIGLRAFQGDDHQLTYATSADATQDEQRTRLADRLRLGLVRYVQETSAADQMRVSYGLESDPPIGGGPPPQTPPPPRAAQFDSSDFWVFRLNAGSNANGEATSKFSNTNFRLSANRTTAAWKMDFGGSYFRRLQEFEFTSGGVTQTVEERQNDWGANALLVRSIGGQWSAGVRANAGSSTSSNQDFRFGLRSGIEYDFFPYAESSRRSLTLQYLVGPEHFRYDETTIFGHDEETRMQESITASIALIEPWGRWSTSVTASHYLHDLSKSNVTVFGGVNIRLFRGLSINANANYAWLRDQLYLSAAGATPEQVLLRQRQLETSYRYFYNVGFEYRFGSIFNNVVNPRFGGTEIFF